MTSSPNTQPLTHFLHIRNHVFFRGRFLEIAAKGGATVAYRTSIANFGYGEVVMIKGAVACCVPADNYCKSTGRDSASRLLTGELGGPTPYRKVAQGRIFYAELGLLSQMTTRGEAETLEVLHDNKLMRAVVQKYALKALEALEGMPPTYWEAPFVSKLQVV